MRGPARIAEVEPAYQLGVRGEMGTVALVTDVVGFGVHISIRGKTRQTEGDFSDFFWVVLRLVQHLSC